MDKSIQRHLAFTKVVDKGSLTKAAEVLYCSQSTVSRLIADLEKEWGVTLLRRDRSGIALTSEGQELLPLSREICSAWNRLRVKVAAMNGLETGKIRIGIISSIATHRMPDAIKSFREIHPGIDFELLLGDYTDIEKWLKEERVDCGFVKLPCDSRLDATPYEADELMGVFPLGHPSSQMAAVPLEVFQSESFLALEHGSDTEIATLFDQAEITIKPNLSTWDDYAIMAMVEKGLGLSILPSLILQRIPYALVCKPLEPPAYRSLGIATKRGVPVSAAVAAFMDYLVT